jgi:predicted Zn-dependent protease
MTAASIDAQQSPRSQPRLTQAQLAAIGDSIVQAEIAEHGRSQNAEWERDVGGLLDRLRRSANVPADQFKWYIVDSDAFNAMAIPGGHMIVYAGLLTSIQHIASALHPRDAAKQRETYLRYTSAVLGHELAHLTLGHTNGERPVLPTSARVAGDTQPRDVAGRIERQMRDPALQYRNAWTRTREEAADRTGALYMFRIGYAIQDAMDLFLALDSLLDRSQREVPPGRAPSLRLRDSLLTVTWLMDHPRWGERMARLEQFRGELRRDQARFDDALVLVRTGLQLDTAISLLNQVLEHFPDLREAEHLRAAALQQKYFREAGPEALQIRSMVATYPARFISKVRGSMALDAARQAYRSLLRDQLLPLTLSNLAVLDAHSGEIRLALARADSAVAIGRAHNEVFVNRAAVRYLAKQYAGALADLDSAATLGAAESPVVVFNRARTLLAMGRTGEANQLFGRYVQEYDDWSDWRNYALSLMGGAGGVTPAGTPQRPPARPAAGASRLPVASPVSLGMDAAAVRRLLGEPERVEASNGGVVWGYMQRGIVVEIRNQQVFAVMLRPPSQGAIDAVRLGSSVSDAIAAWGKPDHAKALDDGGQELHFYRTGFGILLGHFDGRISWLILGRNER